MTAHETTHHKRDPILLHLAVLLFISPTYAMPSNSNPNLSAAYDHCINAGGGITEKLMDCNRAEQARLNRILDEIYNTVARKLSSAKQKDLDKSRRQWLEHREKECWSSLDHSTGYYGTLEMLQHSACILDETNLHIHWLEQHYGNGPR